MSGLFLYELDPAEYIKTNDLAKQLPLTQ